jgi:hypothetical protein
VIALFDLRDPRGPRGESALRRLARTRRAPQHLMIPHLELGRSAATRGDMAAARVELPQAVHLTTDPKSVLPRATTDLVCSLSASVPKT